MTDSKNNTGTENSGDWNSGDWNSGYRNSGDWNSGDRNSGDSNSGYRNSGYKNSGDWNLGGGNSGDKNSGDRNSGDWNSGYGNSGDRNSGDKNSGDRNSGDWNSGDWNSGDRNSGYSNSGYGNSGWFNTDEPMARFFNKETSIKLSDFYNSDTIPSWDKFDLCKWIPEEEMTDEEKKADPQFFVRGGYLKKYEYKEAWANFWRDTSEENRKKFLNLPNFDNKIFLEITGIDVSKDNEKVTRKQEILKKIAELKQEADKL